jgi:predicted ester cyclase
MSLESNKAVVRRLFDEVWSAGNLALLDELLAPGFVDRSAQMGGGDSSAEGLRTQVRLFRTAFPDGRSHIDDLIAEGDRVVARWTDGGTHRGEWMGVAPTGTRVTITGIDIYRFEGDRIGEYWCKEDELGLLRQLGAIEAPE